MTAAPHAPEPSPANARPARRWAAVCALLALAACVRPELLRNPGRDADLVVASGAPAILGADGVTTRSYFVRIRRTPEPGYHEALLRRALIDRSFDGVSRATVLAEMTKAAGQVAAPLCARPDVRWTRRLLPGLFPGETPDEELFGVRCPPEPPAAAG